MKPIEPLFGEDSIQVGHLSDFMLLQNLQE